MTILSSPGAVPSGGSAEPTATPERPVVRGTLHPLHVGVGLVGGSGLLALAAFRPGGSMSVLVSLVAAFVGLAWLGVASRPFGLFSIGGITCAMVATLFIGRWFFPPASGLLFTPLASTYYDREGALAASALMIFVFALTYAVSNRILVMGRRSHAPVMRRTTSEGVADLALIICVLIVLRILSGLFLRIGMPGRVPVAVPFVGVIYYLSSYGPLVAASLILWYGRNRPSSTRLAAALLVVWALIEGALGSHGSTFQAVLVFGATKAMVGAPLRLKTVRTLAAAALVCGAVTASLFLAFVARQPLSGGDRRAVGDIPLFVFNRLGGLEYVAPVIGAVDQMGTDMRRLRPTTWDRYMTVDVYGLPEEAVTAFAGTAVGWWYGLSGLKGVMVGAAICGLAAAQFDRWCERARGQQFAAPPTFLVGILLGWATFLLGGTIGSLGGISIGFTAIAIIMERVHRFIVRSASGGSPGSSGVREV